MGSQLRAREIGRRRPSGLLALLFLFAGLVPQFLENHALSFDDRAGRASSEVSVAATHAGARGHCEASTTEHRDACVACLLQHRAGSGQLALLPSAGAPQGFRPAPTAAALVVAAAILPPSGGRAPPLA